MKYTKITYLLSLIFLFIIISCQQQDDFQKASGQGPWSGKITLALSLQDTNEGEIKATPNVRAFSNDYNDETKDPYISSLWMIIFNKDGTLNTKAKNIKEKLKGTDISYYPFPNDMRYGSEYQLYFITNPESAGIDLTSINSEAEIKALKWGVPTGMVAKDLYTYNKIPKVRMLVAAYTIGMETGTAGGKIYYQRIAPVNYEETTKSYATNFGADLRIPIKLVRTYSTITVKMKRDPEKEKIYKDLHGYAPERHATFSFKGYARKNSIFSKTTVMEETDLLPEVSYLIKISGTDAIKWEVDNTATIKFYFPSISQEEKKITEEILNLNDSGVIHKIEYYLPCLDIMYKHQIKGADTTPTELHVYVNAKDGKVFKPNYNYELPITFYPPEHNIWLVSMRNVKRDEYRSMTIDAINVPQWQTRTFANELHYGTKKPYRTGYGKNKELYSSGVISYGNMHNYSTIIQTISLGAPAKLIDTDIPAWINDIEQLEQKVINDGDSLLFIQLWAVNPKEIPGDNSILRGVIPFRNSIDENDASNDVKVKAIFNILSRFSVMNLGDLNKFANGISEEYNSITNEPNYTKDDEGLYGKVYQFGRNIPIDIGELTNGTSITRVDINLKTANPTNRNDFQQIWNTSNGTRILGAYKSSTNNSQRWWLYANDGGQNEQVTEPEYQKDPWSWIVNKTYELYKTPSENVQNVAPITEDYVGNNWGDPCPGPNTPSGYRYYKMPSASDFSVIFYNKYLGGNKKEIILNTVSFYNTNYKETGVNPGGNPSSTDINTDFYSFYYKKTNGGPIYALRFIGTKWQSFFKYESATRGGNKGVLLTVAPTPSGKSEEELKTMVRNGLQEFATDEKQERFFPFAGIFTIYNSEIYIYDHTSNSNSQYTDFHSNTTIWDKDIDYGFDVDVPFKAWDGTLVVASQHWGLNIRCIRQ